MAVKVPRFMPSDLRAQFNSHFSNASVLMAHMAPGKGIHCSGQGQIECFWVVSAWMRLIFSWVINYNRDLNQQSIYLWKFRGLSGRQVLADKIDRPLYQDIT